MENIKQEFLEKTKDIVSSEKIDKISYLLDDVIIKCMNSYNIRKAVFILNDNFKIISENKIVKDYFQVSFINKHLKDLLNFESDILYEELKATILSKGYFQKTNININQNFVDITSDFS